MKCNPICFLCRRFFKGKFVLRFRKAAWRAVWQYNLSTLLCRWLLSNGSCGKSNDMTRQKLVWWFENVGKEIVKTWAALDAPSKIQLVGMKNGKLREVGQIQVVSTPHTKKPRRHLDES